MAEESEETEPDGEMYLDVVSGRVRRRQGKRKHSRGPYSGAEKRMSRAFQYMMASMHWMDGELADMVAVYLAAQFAATQTVLRKYSYDNVPNPTADDWEALREELGMLPIGVDGGDEFDLGQLSLLCQHYVLACSRA